MYVHVTSQGACNYIQFVCTYMYVYTTAQSSTCQLAVLALYMYACTHSFLYKCRYLEGLSSYVYVHVCALYKIGYICHGGLFWRDGGCCFSKPCVNGLQTLLGGSLSFTHTHKKSLATPLDRCWCAYITSWLNCVLVLTVYMYNELLVHVYQPFFSGAGAP